MAAAMMPCSRCHGLMVPHDLDALPATRCSNCGDVVDEMILRHRACPPQPYGNPSLPTFDPEKHPYAFGADAPGADSDPAAIEEFLGSGT